jgi:collagenase-like PrtC family protease
MRYDLATNLDEKLLEGVIRLDHRRQIKSVYGKLKTDAVGGGRAGFLLPETSMEQLAGYVDKCHAAGIAFNYLLNPMCLGSAEFDPAEQGRILALLDQLYEVGLREYTVNAPYLLELMKKRYSDVRITIGLYAYITTLQQIQYWMNLGADALTLDHGFNRNFGLLRAALQMCKGTGVELRLIANNLCLHNCPFKISHGCSTSHLSKATKLPPFDYNLLSCALVKAQDMSSILSSGFIRPEDVKIYRQLAADVGNEALTLKLVERTRTTAFILNVVEAYLAESYDGNLLDILNWLRKKHMSMLPGPPKLARDAGGATGLNSAAQFNGEAMMRYGKVIDFPEIRVDNRRLDGFIDHFVKHYNCDRVVCRGTAGSCEASTKTTCGYCSDWSKKVISFDERSIQQWISDAIQVRSALADGSMFCNSPARRTASESPREATLSSTEIHADPIVGAPFPTVNQERG